MKLYYFDENFNYAFELDSEEPQLPEGYGYTAEKPDDKLRYSNSCFWNGADWVSDQPLTDQQLTEKLAELAKQQQQHLQQNIQQYLDETAQARKYDSILSACTYATSSNAEFASDGQKAVAWRDAIWNYAIQELEKVKLGQRTMPDFETFKQELPVIDWED